MTETKRRIQELTKALPHMREKVAAVAVLFVLSLTLMVSVSYAWYTLSMKPELGGVNTTVSANGNLEIALSDLDGKEPEPSGVDDSFGANGQTVHGANTTWGNLINISNGYGLESLVLRPAKFDSQSMTYLSSALYGSDGRVEGTASNFAFTTWVKNEDLGTYEFTLPIKEVEDEKGNKEKVLYDAYGVRAISTVTLGDTSSALEDKLVKADELCEEAAEDYQAIMQNQTYMSAIQAVIQIYLNYNVSDKVGIGSGDSDITAYVPTLQKLYKDFYDAILQFGKALAAVADVQVINSGKSRNPYTEEEIRSGADFSTYGINLGKSWTTYVKLEKTVQKDMNDLDAYVKEKTDAGEKIYLSPSEAGDSTLYNIINRLIDIDSAKIDGTTVTALMRSTSGAAGYIMGLSSGQTIEVLVTKGAIYDFETLTDEHMDVTMRNLSLVIKTVHGHLTTSAQGRMFSEAISITKNMDSNYAANMVADDTYGMALDLWFRTNAREEVTEEAEDGTVTTTHKDLILTLDGLPEVETSLQQRMFLPSGQAEPVPVYVYTRYTDIIVEGIRMTEEVLVYKKEVEEKGNDLNEDGVVDTTGEEAEAEVSYIYYDCATYEPVYITKLVGEGDDSEKTLLQTKKYITDDNVEAKKDKVETVIGFTSSNRVTMNELSPDTVDGAISATQGSGSCYVFYADTPDQADSAMELLRHLKLAFVDENGTMTSQAIMDVDRVFAEGGKYTVPLAVTNSEYVTRNTNGEEVYGIASLKKNVAKRISVIVYLEGEDLENSMVMSSESITGSLNLQFSTSQDIRTVDDNALVLETISLRAEIADGKTKAGEKGWFLEGLKYDGTTTFAPELTAYVEGLTPAKVEAVFQRQINASQGRQMTPVVLRHDAGDIWVGNCTFNKPGTYVLRSLRVDGVDYALPEDSYITVTVEGFTLSHVAFCELEEEKLELTTNQSALRTVTVGFDASLAAQPSTVEARFTTENGRPVSTKLRLDNNGYWTGTAEFTASGTYTLQYLVLDGEYFELDPPEDINGNGVLDTGEDTNGNGVLDKGMQRTFTAYLGLRAQVTLERFVQNEDGLPVNQLEFEYKGPEDIDVYVDILTDTGEKLAGFEDVTLNYNKRGTAVTEYAPTALLKWKNQQYVGTFNVESVGVFNFANVQVGTSNTITSAVSAPTIRSISTTPPSYVESNTEQLMIMQDGGTAAVTATFSDVESVEELQAVFTNEQNGVVTEYPVVGAPAESKTKQSDSTEGVLAQYTFAIPKRNADGMENIQNGVWTLKEFRVYGVYDAAGNYYGKGTEEGEPDTYYTLMAHATDVYTVVKDFVVTVSSRSFGSSADTGFMTPHTLNGEMVTIKTPGITLPEYLSIANVKITLKHNGDSKTKGGYTFTGTHSEGNITYNLTESTEKDKAGVYVFAQDNTVTLAGTYSYKVEYSLKNSENSGTYTYTLENEKTTVMTIYSKTPTVTIDSITPSGPHTTVYEGKSIIGTAMAKEKTVTSGINGNTITVYAEATADRLGRVTMKTQPTVTLQIDGLGKASEAYMTFAKADGSAVRLYIGASYSGEQTDSFVWTAGGSDKCTRHVGYYDTGNCSNTKLAGTLTATALTLKYEGAEYSVEKTITIINEN